MECWRYAFGMAERINLADPTFEPTDEQLQELSRRAFAHVPAQNAAAAARLRARIAEGRATLMKELEPRLAELRARQSAAE